MVNGDQNVPRALRGEQGIRETTQQAAEQAAQEEAAEEQAQQTDEDEGLEFERIERGDIPTGRPGPGRQRGETIRSTQITERGRIKVAGIPGSFRQGDPRIEEAVGASGEKARQLGEEALASERRFLRERRQRAIERLPGELSQRFREAETREQKEVVARAAAVTRAQQAREFRRSQEPLEERTTSTQAVDILVESGRGIGILGETVEARVTGDEEQLEELSKEAEQAGVDVAIEVQELTNDLNELLTPTEPLEVRDPEAAERQAARRRGELGLGPQITQTGSDIFFTRDPGQFIPTTIVQENVGDVAAIFGATPAVLAKTVAAPRDVASELVTGGVEQASLFIEQPGEIRQEVVGELTLPDPVIFAAPVVTTGAARTADIAGGTARFATGRFEQDLFIPQEVAPGVVETFETPGQVPTTLRDTQAERDVTVDLEETISVPVGRRVEKTRRSEFTRAFGFDPVTGRGLPGQRRKGAVGGGTAQQLQEPEISFDEIQRAEPAPRFETGIDTRTVSQPSRGEFETLFLGTDQELTPSARQRQLRDQELEEDLFFESFEDDGVLFEQTPEERVSQRTFVAQEQEFLTEFINEPVSLEEDVIPESQLRPRVFGRGRDEQREADELASDFLGGEEDTFATPSLSGDFFGIVEEDTPDEFSGLEIRGLRRGRRENLDDFF